MALPDKLMHQPRARLQCMPGAYNTYKMPEKIQVKAKVPKVKTIIFYL